MKKENYKNVIILLLVIALLVISILYIINKYENKKIIQSANLNNIINEYELIQKQNLNETVNNVTSDLEYKEEKSENENEDSLVRMLIKNYNRSNIDKDENVYFKRADSNIIIKYFRIGENSKNIVVYDENQEVFRERLNQEVKDIASVDYYYGNDIYILFEDGNMSKIDITLGEDDRLEYKYEQLNDKKNIDKLFVIVEEYESAGANIVLYAIDKNGEIIFLDAVAD